MERPDTTVKVRVAGGAGVAGNHDDGAHGSVLGDETGSGTAGDMLAKDEALTWDKKTQTWWRGQG